MHKLVNQSTLLENFGIVLLADIQVVYFSATVKLDSLLAIFTIICYV